jgi:hypothetical protein
MGHCSCECVQVILPTLGHFIGFYSRIQGHSASWHSGVLTVDLPIAV